MKTKMISVCINTKTKEVKAFQSLTDLSAHVKVNRKTIERKSKTVDVIKDIEGYMIFLGVEYIPITRK